MILAVGVAAEGTTITAGFGYDTVGPRAVPYMIAAGLFASGLSILWPAVRGGAPGEMPAGRNWIAVAAISAALILQMLLVQPLGWILTSTVAFAVVARVFGRSNMLQNLLFGLVLASATFALFNFGLGFRLPVGRLVEKLF
jgi:putative tricarboxylic transport membrane protein